MSSHSVACSPVRPLVQRRVSKYDGQTVWVDGEPAYEIGNFLGAGVAGSYVAAVARRALRCAWDNKCSHMFLRPSRVHEAIDLDANRHVAIKVLNPVGYKLCPNTSLQKCLVAVKVRAGLVPTPSGCSCVGVGVPPPPAASHTMPLLPPGRRRDTRDQDRSAAAVV